MSYPELLTPTEMLAAAKRGLDLPRVIVICGSTRFVQEMIDVDRELTWLGNAVFAPTRIDLKTADPLWADPAEAEAGKARLDALHRGLIRFADEVLVVGDYIGDSTRSEIDYARLLGKPVEFTHPEVDPALTDGVTV